MLWNFWVNINFCQMIHIMFNSSEVILKEVIRVFSCWELVLLEDKWR